MSSHRAVLHARDRIPQDRLQQLEATIRDYYGVDEITDELLRQVAEKRTL